MYAIGRITPDCHIAQLRIVGAADRYYMVWIHLSTFAPADPKIVRIRRCSGSRPIPWSSDEGVNPPFIEPPGGRVSDIRHFHTRRGVIDHQASHVKESSKDRWAHNRRPPIKTTFRAHVRLVGTPSQLTWGHLSRLRLPGMRTGT